MHNIRNNLSVKTGLSPASLPQKQPLGTGMNTGRTGAIHRL